ncbi:MAG TPA: tRNA preQ1(34) S-adenosylmethionine ribosyltransferase-isomerase QueA, partial [Bacillota bacterium]
EWRAMVRPGRRVREGETLLLADDLQCRVVARDEQGGRRLRFEGPDLERRLRALGRLPLPPYIRREPRDPQRYQTVYAACEGSIAAPTAGLHFTPELLDRLAARGVAVTRLTLHVGPGTFRPVRGPRVEDHVLDAERYVVPGAAAAAVAAARRRGGRVIAVGTTVARTLETVAEPGGMIRPGSGRTGLFILPGHRFQVVDALLTNLHLPRSTLLMLVAAFAGRDRIRAVYREAVRCRYRFFSFGDAMLLLGGARGGDPLHPA